MKRRTAEITVGVCFLIATAAAVGFVTVYILAMGTQLLGALLGIAFAALAFGLVLWAAHLLPSGTFVEKREPMQPPAPTQTAFLDTLDRGQAETPGIVRRTLVLSLLGLAAAFVVPMRSLLLPNSPRPGIALTRSEWSRGKRLMTHEGSLVRAEDVPLGSALTVFPEDQLEADDATAMLLHLDPRDVNRPGSRIAQYATGGLVAFSKLCTHAGCPVGLYEQTTRQLLCPCHQSTFDVLRGAEPIAGPAARPLPQLPLGIDDEGYVVATGDFHGQVGPTYWRRE